MENWRFEKNCGFENFYEQCPRDDRSYNVLSFFSK